MLGRSTRAGQDPEGPAQVAELRAGYICQFAMLVGFYRRLYTDAQPVLATHFNTARQPPRQGVTRLNPGIYRIFWLSGGYSHCAIGMTSNDDNWIAPTNWLQPVMLRDLEDEITHSP